MAFVELLWTHRSETIILLRQTFKALFDDCKMSRSVSFDSFGDKCVLFGCKMFNNVTFPCLQPKAMTSPWLRTIFRSIQANAKLDFCYQIFLKTNFSSTDENINYGSFVGNRRNLHKSRMSFFSWYNSNDRTVKQKFLYCTSQTK